MNLLRQLAAAAFLASSAACASQFEIKDLVRVSCSSEDNGKTCYGYGEIYGNGTSDACGRVPGGPEFAMKMAYEFSGDEICQTVVRTSHQEVMPVGQRVCYTYLERKPREFTFRFSDDPPEKVRHSYDASKSDKWCQHLIDALP